MSGTVFLDFKSFKGGSGGKDAVLAEGEAFEPILRAFTRFARFLRRRIQLACVREGQAEPKVS